MKVKSLFRRYFVAGLIFWLPILATVWIVRLVLNLLDQSFALLPATYHPTVWFGVKIPGLSVVLALFVLFFTGMIVSNVIGRYFVRLWERILDKIPLVRSIYGAVKQVLDTLFNQQEQSFRQVVMLEYPRKGIWSIAFKTAKGFDQAQTHVGKQLCTIFVPTTPNPTSGFFMLVPVDEVHPLNISVDEALKMVISLGVVMPNSQKPARKN